MIASSGVNFINALRAVFTCADPKSARKTVKLMVIFALLGFAHAKADCRKLIKLTPKANVIKEKTCRRSYKKISLSNFFEFFAVKLCHFDFNEFLLHVTNNQA